MEPSTDPPSDDMTVYEQEQFVDWLEVGMAAGWISTPDCQTHQGVPLRDWEEYQFEQGSDPCVVVSRIWLDGYQHLTMADVLEDEREFEGRHD